MKVTEYNKLINYNSGNTSHFENGRILRERELTRLLGIGVSIKKFIIEKDNELQIQEILDNAIIRVYSYETHKKVTMFAPNPERLISLFEAIGQLTPDHLLAQSEFNFQNGYNSILSEQKKAL